MAGLLAQHVLLGHSDALATTLKMADYFCNRSQDVVKTKGREHWNAVLNTEFGGMNEASLGGAKGRVVQRGECAACMRSVATVACEA